MKVVAIVQARMGSTRLPGKVLKQLGSQSVLAHVINRLRSVPAIHEVVVATTTESIDQAIVHETVQLDVPCYRGSEYDVLSRYYEAARQHRADVIVRITSDCPLIDPDVTGQCIDFFFRQQVDYASNTIERTFPRGLDTEVFTMEALQTAQMRASLPYQREHVTPYLYQNPALFKMAHYKDAKDYSHYRWTLDTVEDWLFITSVVNRCESESIPLSYSSILKMLDNYPELIEINAHVEQKKLESGTVPL
ncbi:cytidylyltransferase [Paenibacillus sp. 32O-W]|uniref:cytidylyltransferase domain-containing protein n=1 Tax=Paenibacillus sp. 32O-W TaxID=1695218 RepID=UPI00072166C0|nr:glycosyltransferase family protein [Paenibacillus sp. 32O-W]ALS26099.1 cytidylyltransferase [Paenibacillus sp. 32O-W]